MSFELEPYLTGLVPQERPNTGMLLPLFESGLVTRLVVTYDGYGDSGTAELSEWEAAAEFDPDTLKTPSGMTLREAIEEATYQILPGGWEINEGSCGTLTVTYEEGRVKVSIEHGWRVTEIQYEEYEL